MTTYFSSRRLVIDLQPPALAALLHAAAVLQAQLSDTCARHDITYDQYVVLRLLRAAHPEGRSRSAIAARLTGRAPDVTRLLDRLERDGLVVRQRSELDRRISLCALAYEGVALLRDMEDDVRAVTEAFAAGLSPAERDTLLALCRELASAAPPRSS